MKNNNGMLLTTGEFVARARKTHGNKYDYSKTVYTGAKNKIFITCKIHGDFYQRPDCHLRCGCPRCGILKRTSSADNFVLRSEKIHDNKYSYEKVKYTNKNTNIIIKCPIHGYFNQTPASHLNGSGCPICAGNTKLNTNEFIKKAKKIHANKYDYSKSKYISAKDLITIICPIHGSFQQTPNNHISKHQGCKKCNRKSSVSKCETEFLNKLKILKKFRQKRINRYFVDGYDPKTNTIYEFLGDYWHGNPIIYKSKDVNEISKKTFGELYQKTIEKFDKLKFLGYNIKYIWENDWDTWTRNRKINLPIKVY